MTRQLKHFAILTAFAVGASGLVYGAGWRQNQENWRDSHDSRDTHNQNADRAYQEGLAQGQRDRAHNSHQNHRTSAWQHGDSAYRDAYQRGYEAGYNSGNNRGYNHNLPNAYPPNAGNPAYGGRYGNGNPNRGNGGYGNQAYSQGMQDGRMDGQRDRATGHSFRPTQGDNYKHADRGYNSSMGDKDMYKQQYRNGYTSAYEQGYRGGR